MSLLVYITIHILNDIAVTSININHLHPAVAVICNNDSATM